MIEARESSPEPAAKLWGEFSKPVRAFLRARARNDADADDLLQEVFYRIHSRLSGLRQPEKLQGWVYAIARNAVIDYYRIRKTDVPLLWDAAAELPSEQAAVDLTPSLRRFIAQLPCAYREPLVRHEFQGAPLDHVAREMGLTLTATKSRVRRARAMLRKMLDQCCRFEFDRRGRVIDAIPREACVCQDCPPPAKRPVALPLKQLPPSALSPSSGSIP
jgi:RNA polymerase sigma-70 factor (ECF subfamily)